jgi:hypothetical protein
MAVGQSSYCNADPVARLTSKPVKENGMTLYWALETLRYGHVVVHSSDCILARRLRGGGARELVSTWHGPYSDLAAAAWVASEIDPFSAERRCECCEATEAFQDAARRRRSRACAEAA